jgi:hypothetical protein
VTAREQEASPFLSVVVPVGTAGEQALRETLLCLVGQDDVDFEVLLVVPEGGDLAGVVDTVVADQPPRTASRLRVLRTGAGSPGAVRNAGLAVAEGRYVTVLPEGDLVLGGWVARFHAAEQSADGRVLRALGVTQDHALVEVAGHEAVRAVDSPLSDSPALFSVWQHALEPLTPAAGWAWPRTLAGAQSLAYDEDVADDPDWELLVRTAQLVGVADLGAVTSVHRRWTSPASSDRAGAGTTAQAVIDDRPLVLPPGEAARMRAGGSESAAVGQLAAELDRTREELRLTHDHASNLEGVVRHLEEQAAQVERRHAKEVARLRRKLQASGPHDPGSASPSPARGRGWRPRRRDEGPSD